MAYNLFAQQKQQYYPNAQTVQPVGNVPGTSVGETPEQFAAGKQAANSQAGQAGQPSANAPGTVAKTAATPAQQGGQVSYRLKQYTGGANNAQAALDYLGSLYTSPQEEERLRKASVANQRIMAIGDALRHIGNIYHTVKGAPSQQFNSPVQEEYARYQQGKAMRDKANQLYYTYQQQKAAQDAAMKRYADTADLKLQQLQFQQEKFNRQQNLNEFKAKTDKWYKEATLEQKEAALEIQRQLAEGRISLMDANRALAEVKTRQGGFAPKSGGSGGRGGGSSMPDYDVDTTYNRDSEGRVISSTKTRRVRHTDGQTTQTSKTTKRNAYGGTRHGSGGKGQKENKFGVRPAK